MEITISRDILNFLGIDYAIPYLCRQGGCNALVFVDKQTTTLDSFDNPERIRIKYTSTMGGLSFKVRPKVLRPGAKIKMAPSVVNSFGEFGVILWAE